MIKTSYHKRVAFSFVEILVAITCLAIVMIPLTSMFSLSSSATIRNRNEILARQHSANLLDYSFSLPYNDKFLKPVSNKPVQMISLKSGSDVLLLVMEDIFTRTLTIEEVKPKNWKYSYKIIKVKTSWFEKTTNKKEQILTALVTNEKN